MEIKAFTDGSSRGNPGPGGWGAVVILGDRVRELAGEDKKTTNNRMELSAAIGVLVFVKKNHGKEVVTILTDSVYVLNGASKWISNWKKNGWKTSQKSDVLNKDLWMKLDELQDSLHVKWERLPGHSGVPGNERADVLATSFADGESVKLFDGALSTYPYGDLSQKVPTVGSGKAYSYLSLVNGEFKTHKTWEQCKATVQGAKGAQFRKALSKENENEIKRSWGVSQ